MAKRVPTTHYQLDYILSILWLHRVEKHLTFEDIAEYTAKELSGGEVPFGDILSILHRLEKDGFVEFDDRAAEYFNYPDARVYQITFDGRHWHEQGGYGASQSRKDAENTRLEKIEKSQKLFRLWTIWLTAILAVGTVIAALYYATELYWNHGWFHFGK